MTTQLSCHLSAPRHRVYAALLDPADVARWRYPSGMTCEIHRFEPVEGGRLRVSLTYESADRVGKSTGRTDTYHGRFVQLVPDELVIEVDEFETDDVGLRGEMTMTIRLADADGGGTMLLATHEGLPAGISEADNEAGWREALSRLATLLNEAR